MTSALALQRTDVPSSVTDMMQISKFMAASKMLPNHLAGDEASVFAVMTAARSLDIPMWAAFQQIIVQKGRTSMSATLMQALVLRSGYNLYVMEDRSGDQGATVYVERPGIGVEQCGHAEVSFTVEDALRAKLVSKNEKTGALMARSQKGEMLPWEAYTADMFIWRAISRACRRYFPDVLMGMLYTPEEVGALVDDEGKPLRAGAVTVEVSPEVSELALRIAACEDRKTLRVIHAELTAKRLDSAEVDGVSLLARLKMRLKDLPDDKPVQAALAEAAPEEPQDAVVVEDAPDAEEAAPAPAEDEAPAPVEEAPAAAEDAPGVDLVAALQRSTDAAKSGESVEDAAPDEEWAALAAEADSGAPAVIADPEETRQPSKRREAIENTLVSLFEGVEPMEAAALEYFGLPSDDVSTERLQAWAVLVRNGGE
jgi:hypothetical protein